MISFLGILLALFLMPTKLMAQDGSIAGAIRSVLNPSAFGNNQNAYLNQNDEANQLPEDLVLAVYANRRPISGGIFAIQNKGRYYLPVSELSDVFGFPNDWDRENRLVKGSTLSEKDKFVIDGVKNVLSLRGQTADLPSEAVLEDGIEDDLYVQLEVLEEIWPVQLNVDIQTLALNVIPDQELPFELKAQRKQKQERALERAQRRGDDKTFPFLAYPYKAFTKPVVDLSADASYAGERDVVGTRVRLSGGNDLAYAEADYSATLGYSDGEIIEPENIRFRLRRQNIHEGALPLGLEDVQVGDVNLNNRSLISSGISGRGFYFSSEVDDKHGEFDQITIDGIAIPGWEVELYHNNQLTEFGDVDDRGEYRFEDVLLRYGNNRFRIVLYGPQGQIEERFENHSFGTDSLKRGEFAFIGGLVDLNEPLIPIDDDNDQNEANGISGNIYGAYGLHRNVTAFATGNLLRDRVQGEDLDREYVSAGAITTFGGVLGQTEFYKQLDGGTALDVRAFTNFLSFNVNGRASIFDDFESPDAGEGDNAKKIETDITLRKNFRLPVGNVGTELQHNYLRRQAGDDRTRYTTRLTLNRAGIHFGNNTITSLSDGDHTSTNGNFSVSSRHDRWNFRNTIGYSVHPNVDVNNLQSELRYSESVNRRRRSTALQVGYSPQSQEKRLGLQISEDFKKFLGSVGTTWSSRDGIGLTLRTSTSLGPYGEDDRYLARSNSFSNLGPVNSFVYQDVNYDGVFNEGDRPIEGAKVRGGNRYSQESTNEGGHLTEFLSERSSGLNVSVATETVDDPYLAPAIEGYKIRPRSGVVHKLDFPFIETGAIDGTLKRNAAGSPLAGVDLQLLNEQADVIQTTQTAADGYFTFEQIPPGNYTIRADPAGEVDIPFKYVTLTPDDLFHFGTNIDADIKSAGQAQNPGLETAITKSGALNVKNIVSLARSYKDKNKKKAQLHKASVSNNGDVNAVSANYNNVTQTQKVNVSDIRIGKHVGKARVVLDLSGPVKYGVSHDKARNSVIVDMPNASLSAQNNWVAKQSGILKKYSAKATGQGVRLVLETHDNVKLGASGLLKPYAGKLERLYIDIEKK